MTTAYIVDALRTPVGKRRGGLSQVHPADLGAHVLRSLVERNDFDPAAVEDVVFGCVDTIGPQAGDIARTCWLAAGLPDEVPGTTVDRQCGSSQQAVHFAAQGVMSGTQDLVVAGGVQNMSMIPIASAMTCAEPLGFGDPFSGSTGWQARYGDKAVSQFHSAEMIAEKWEITRDDMERFALESHDRAIAAQDAGWFEREIVPLAGIASEKAVKDHGFTPRARIHHLSVRGADPIWMLTAPIPATAYAMKKSGMSLDDIDAVEINEAFASVALAWLKETGYDPAKTNPVGGAIALGHPLGATGARLMTTLLHTLERTGGRYGLQTMCEGGGQANVTIIERLA